MLSFRVGGGVQAADIEEPEVVSQGRASFLNHGKESARIAKELYDE